MGPAKVFQLIFFFIEKNFFSCESWIVNVEVWIKSWLKVWAAGSCCLKENFTDRTRAADYSAATTPRFVIVQTHFDGDRTEQDPAIFLGFQESKICPVAKSQNIGRVCFLSVLIQY